MNSDSLWRRAGAGLVALALSLSVSLASGSEGPILEEIQFPGGMSAEFVRDENDVTVMDFSGNFDRYLEGTTPNNAARAVLAREFFQHHADDYDFLFFFSLFDYELNGAAAFHLGAKNAVQGIGRPIYDNTSVYGSEGRLLGTIDMGTAILDEAKTDPTSPEHEHLLVTTMHEMLHQWGIDVDFIDPETGERSSDLLGSDDAHWSSLVHTSGSVELGAKWLDNGDGTFTAAAERLFYSPLDLYLMGMASPDEVPPFFLVEDPEPAIDPDAVTALGKTVQGRRKNLTIQDIIAAEGPRQPSWQDAQTSFNTAFIIVKRPGQEVPPEVYGRINTLRETAAQRFSILTGGRGIMHVYSRVRPTGSVGEADDATGDAGERQGAYDQADALDWLRSAQTPGGYWQDKSATALRDSLLAHGVLVDLDPLYTDAGRNAFQTWLNTVTAKDNDGRSRLVMAGVAGATNVADELVNAQRADGGWGLSADHESSPLDTALVLQALSGRPQAAQATLEARAWLQSVQNTDGGWGAVTGGGSEVATTARVLRALGRGADANIAGQATAWLAGRQTSDGSFGGEDNAVVATAETLWALADGEALEGIDVPAAVQYLKKRQGADGSWDSSVFNTALVVKSLGRVQFGNWSVSDLSASAGELHDGQHLTLTATIRNDGNVPTPGIRVVLYLGDPENGGTTIDSVDIPAIASGAGVDVTFDWDSLGYTGDQEIHLVVDPENLVGERTELDNGAYVPVTVTPPPEGVDLIAGAISQTPPTISALPTTAGLSAVVRNAGDEAAQTVSAEWWVDRDGESQLLESLQIDLSARSAKLLTTDYQWTEAGARTFSLVLDGQKQIDEVDEDNNESRLVKATQDRLDLEVTEDDIQFLNMPAYGQTLDAEVTIHNRGTTASPTFAVDFLLRGAEDDIPLDHIQMALAAGESRTLEVPWSVNQLGDFRLVASIDLAQQVAEFSEDNNEAGKAFTAEVVDGYNLQVSPDDLAVEPQPLLEGYGATLSALIRNTGNQSASSVRVHFYDGKPESGGTLVAEMTLPEVAPGTAAPVQAVWPTVSGSGERSVYAVVDPEGVIEEFDETDNQAFRVVQIQSLPDLALESGAIALSPPMVAEGEVFTATVKVTNLGSQSVGEARVSLFRNSIADQNRIGEQTVAIEGNGQVELVFNGSAQVTGEEQLHVVVDEDDSIEELREDNNASVTTLAVQDGRFYIDHPHISPDGDGTRDSVTLVYRTTYPEGAYLSVESEAGTVVRSLPVEAADGGRITWTGRNEGGGIVDDGRYELVLRSAGGGELDSVSVVVDNNRSPITESLLEENRGYRRNLTCALPNDPIENTRWMLSDDEQSIYFDKNRANAYPGTVNGVYHSDFSGGSLTRVASRDAIPIANEIRLLATSPDGNRVAYAISLDSSAGSGDQYPVDIYEKRMDSADPARLLMSVDLAIMADAAYGADGQTLYVLAAGESMRLFNASTGQLIKDYGFDSRNEFQYVAELLPNRDRSRIVVNVSEGEWVYTDQQAIDLLNTESDSLMPLAFYDSDDFFGGFGRERFSSADEYFCEEGQECETNPALSWRVEAAWSPAGNRFALVGTDRQLHIHNADGALTDTVTLRELASGANQLIKSLTWSSDGERLAFFYGGATVNDGLFAGGYVHVLDLGSGNAEQVWPFYVDPYANDGTTSESRVLQEIDQLVYLPSDQALLYQDYDGSQIITFSDEPKLHDVSTDLGYGVQLSPRGRSILYRNVPEQTSCNLDDEGEVVEQLYGFDSLDNLTVSLRVLRSAEASAFRINGTVTDRHFDRFALEYSANGKDGWRPIRPDGAAQYIDEVITSWVPPAPGRYFVRLTGFDKAGNQASAMQQVVWSEQSPLTDIYLDQDLFSPNGDGARDQVGVHFTVRAPINLPVHVYSGETLIRSFQNAYDTIGEEVWLYWDGRDGDGRIVPDGEYRIEILGIEYWVTIDNTYPNLSLGMSSLPYSAECLGIADIVLGSIFHLSAYDTTPRPSERSECKEEAEYRGESRFLALNYLLQAGASDQSRALPVRLESAMPGQDNWRLVTQETESPTVALDEGQITERKFRATAVDEAGNVSTQEYVPARIGLATVLRLGPAEPSDSQRLRLGPEFLHLGEPIPVDAESALSDDTTFGPVSNVGGVAHVTLSETLKKEVVAVHVEHRAEDEQGWTREPVTDFLHADWELCKKTAFNQAPRCAEPVVSPLIPEHRIHLLWDMAAMPAPSRSRLARFVLTTEDAREVITPHIRVSPRAFAVGEFQRSALLPQADMALTGTVYNVGDMERVSVHVQSDEDGSYTSERLLGTAFPEETAVGSDGSLFAVDASDLMYCRTYQVRAVLTQTNGAQSVKEKVLRTPCMQLLYRVEYPDSLNAPDNGQELDIIVWPVTRADVPLKSLQLFAPLANGGRDVIATRNDITENRALRLGVDISSWPAGETELALRLVDQQDNELVEPVSIYKDVGAPEIELSYPLEGDLICGAQPFQVYYEDGIGSDSASLPEGWSHIDRIYSRINKSGDWSSLVYDAETEPRAPADSSLHAVNIQGAALDGIKGMVSGEAVTHVSSHAELIFETLAADGSVSQRFALWDRNATPDEDFPSLEGPREIDGKMIYRDLVALPWEADGAEEGILDTAIRITGTDAVGNRSALTRNIRMDVSAVPPEYRIDDGANVAAGAGEAYISPNGDGIRDNLQLYVSNYEAGTLEIRLYEGAEVAEGDNYEVIYRRESAAPGEYTYTWDGTSNGTLLSDGAYRIEPVLTDGCGNVSSVSSSGITVQLDTTAPLIESPVPAAGSPLGLLAELRARLLDTHLDTSAGPESGISYRPSGGVDEIAIEGDFDGSPATGVDLNAEWNTYGLSGNYELVWRARDLAGNTTETVVPVVLQEKANLLSGLKVDTPHVSPNADGNRDRLRYRVTVLQPVDVVVTVKTSSGTPVTDILSTTLQPGETTLSWDGDTSEGVVADGNYRLSVTATSREFTSLTQTVESTFAVDTVSPEIDVPGLSDGLLDVPHALVASVIDEAPEQYQISLTGEGVETVLARGDGGLAETILANLAQGYAEGDYRVSAEATDLAGNRTQVDIPFVLDLTPPLMNWVAPAETLIGGTDAITMSWSLSLEDAHPDSLEVSLTDDQGTATSLHTSQGRQGSIEGTADIDGLNGNYTLTALATDATGAETRIEKRLRLDHQGPQTAITLPADGTYISSEFSVEGIVEDANLARWTLTLRDTSDQVLETLTNRVEPANGQLGTYPVPADGQYRLVLEAVDAVGYESRAGINAIVDTQPPVAPTDLSVTELGGGEYRLAWSPSTSPDVTHYQVLDRGQSLNDLVSDTGFSFTPTENDSYRFTVVAFDAAGLAGDPSQPLDWVMDTEGPSVTLSAPADGKTLSGLVDVVGSVSGEDLDSYSLASAPVALPGNRRTFASSSLPRSGEKLGQWNTLDEAGDGDYLLSLSARDRAGNETEQSVVITLDNTAPEAPNGLQASVNGNDVDLVWTASPSTDAEGYLVMRNDRIANADGPVVGDITPYLIDGTGYLDESVPDGDHVYSVHAVDGAGNISAPVSASVALDNRAPSVTWAEPDPGEAFEDSLTLRATSEDEDITVVRFRYRAVGDSTWTDLSPDLSIRPWVLSWQTTALAYQDFELQARAWDEGGRSGESGVITVSKQDLTPPVSPSELNILVEGDVAHLTWDASGSDDLQEYRITALRDEGEVDIERITAPQTSLSVPSLDDGTHRFIVRAVDASGNQSAGTESREGRVFKPQLDAYKGVTDASSVSLSGSVVAGEVARLYREGETDRTLLSEVPISVDGGFDFGSVALLEGENGFAVQVETQEGDLSRFLFPVVIRTEMPGKVRNLDYEFPSPDNTEEVTLRWDPPLNAPDAYYLIRDAADELLLDLDAIMPVGYFTEASYSWNERPEYAFDDSPYSDFRPQQASWSLNVVVEESTWVSAVGLHWRYEPVSVRVSGRVAGVWKILDELHADDFEDEDWILELATPQPVDELRLDVSGGTVRPGLGDVFIGGVFPGPDRSFTYQGEEKEEVSFNVSAVTELGVEGPAETVDVRLGDWQAPEPVTLSAQASGSEVALSWTASSSTDVDRYLVYRGDDPVAAVPAPTLTHADMGLPNGSYEYRVRPLDQAGNPGEFSNVVPVTVAAEPPESPSYVDASADAVSGCIEVTWSESVDASHYQVLRSENGSDPMEIAQVAATSYSDCDLYPAVEYAYSIVPVDGAGNPGGAVVGDGLTALDDQPPEAPAILRPVEAGENFQTETRRVDISGRAEGGSHVVLLRDGYRVAETDALGTPGVAEPVTYASGDAVDLALSPAARTLAVANTDGSIDLFDWPSRAPLASHDAPAAGEVGRITWIDEERLLVGSIEPGRVRLQILSVGDGTTTDLASRMLEDFPPRLELYIRRDLNKAVFAAINPYTRDAYVSLVDLGTGAEQALLDTTSGELYEFSISPGGDRLLWENQYGVIISRPGQPSDPVRCSGQPVGWLSDPEMPLLVRDQDLIACDEDGNITVIDERIHEGSDLFIHQSLPAGTSFLALGEQQSGGRDVLALVNGLARKVGRIETGVSGPILLEGYQGNGAVWFQYMDDNTGGQGIEMTPPLFNFSFEGISTEPGLNSFKAYAVDRFGNQSQTSQGIHVQRSTAPVSNLSVELQVPGAVNGGYPLPISIIVENDGNQPTSSTDLQISVFAADGNRYALASELVPALAAGESHVIDTAWTASGVGVAVIEARLDAGMTVPEDNESDNRATADVRVTVDQMPVLSVSGDISGPPGAYRYLSWSLANPALRGYQGELVLTVLSQDGAVIQELSRTSAPVAAGQSVSGRLSFKMPALQAWVYQLELLYRAAALSEPAAEQTPLVVEQDLRVSAALSGTVSNYGARRNVPLIIDLAHIGVSGILESAELEVNLIGPGGDQIESWQRPVATLLPGDSQRHSIDWNTGVEPPGDYRFDVTLHDGQDVPILQRQRPFTIDGGVPLLNGQLSSSADLVGQGRPLPTEWQITNDGNMPLSDARVRIDAHAGSGTVVNLFGTLGDLPVQASLEEAIQLDTTPLAMGGWTLELFAEVELDGGTREYRLASLPIEVRDISGPELSVVSPVPGSTVNGPATILSAAAADADSGVASVEWRAGAGEWRTMTLSGDSYQTGLAALPEGQHLIEVRARDLSGNLSSVSSLTVQVDNTRPAVHIGGVQGGVFYDGAVQPTVTVDDASAVTVARRLNGLPWSGEPVVADRVHELVVEATDAAGNFRRSSVMFTIDTTAPSIQITGAEDGGLYNAPVTPQVTVFDANPDETTLMLDGASYTEGTPVSGEGGHSFSASARDRAGNSSSRAIAFTIDTVAPFAPQVTSISDGQVVDYSVLDVAGSAEPWSEVALVFDGITRTAITDASGHFLFPAVPFLEGDNTISLSATDAAGNTSTSTSLTFTVQTDVEPPVLQVTGVEDGGYYASTVAVGVEITDESAVVSSSITVNGSPYTPGTAIEMDGDYELHVEAEDEYGNRARLDRTFVIDTQAPGIIIGAVSDGGEYNHEVTPTVAVEDASPTDVTMTLDGSPWQAGAPVITEGSHTLRVEAVDAAGNSSDDTVGFNLDFTSPAVPVIETPVPGGKVRGPVVTISGSAEPGATVTLTLAGTAYVVDVSASGQFSLAASLADGTYHLFARTTDPAGNTSAEIEVEFEVVSTVVMLDVDQEPPETRVLLWEAGAHGQPPQDGSWYQQSLRRSGIMVRAVHSEEAFLEELDSGAHNVLMLTSPGGDFGPPLHMSLETIMRIRGSVAGGYGLAWINTMPNLIEVWHDVIGARTVSVLPHAEQVEYVLNEQTVLAPGYDGRASGVHLLTASAEGQVLPECDADFGMWLLCTFGNPDFASAITNDYGRGRVKMLTFEPPGLADQTLADQVVLDLVSDVSPDDLAPLPGVRSPQRVIMERNLPGEELYITVTVPEGLEIFPAGDAERPDQHTARWHVGAGVLETTVRYGLRGELAGGHHISVEVTGADTQQLLKDAGYDFVIEHSVSSLIEATRSRLETGQGEHPAMMRLVERWFERAVTAYEQGRHDTAGNKLYMAMLKLRLSPGYDRELMALLGDFQRVLAVAGE